VATLIVDKISRISTIQPLKGIAPIQNLPIFDAIFKVRHKMKKETRNILLSVLTGALLLCAIAGGTVYYYLFAPQFHPSKTFVFCLHTFEEVVDTHIPIYLIGLGDEKTGHGDRGMTNVLPRQPLSA